MAEIRLVYLFKFLEKHSKFFTSAAFFGVLLTLTLFIEPSSNVNLNWAILILQSSALLLFILCIWALIIELQRSKAKILQIYSFLMSVVFLALLVYLWYQYEGIILGVLVLASVFLGYFIIDKVMKKINLLLQRKLKFKSKDLWYYLLFILVLLPNFYLIFQGVWGEFVSVVDIDSLIQNFLEYMFVGFGLWLFLKIFGLFFDFLYKIKIIRSS